MKYFSSSKTVGQKCIKLYITVLGFICLVKELERITSMKKKYVVVLWVAVLCDAKKPSFGFGGNGGGSLGSFIDL